MQCKAIAKSTNSRCRASVKAQSEYCDAHVPKEVVKNDSVSSAEEIPSTSYCSGNRRARLF